MVFLQIIFPVALRRSELLIPGGLASRHHGPKSPSLVGLD